MFGHSPAAKTNIPILAYEVSALAGWALGLAGRVEVGTARIKNGRHPLPPVGKSIPNLALTLNPNRWAVGSGG